MLRFNLCFIEETGSTNSDVLAEAERGAEEGLVICAERQNAGRGRRGREWQSPKGNLYASLLVKPKNQAMCGQIALLTALAIAQALTKITSERVAIKWPNDVLVNGAKVAGILLEQSGDALVVGFGVNIVSHPANTPYQAASIAETGQCITAKELLEHILARFAALYEILSINGFSAIKNEWLALAKGIGEEITVRLPESEISGQFVTIDGEGYLHLKDNTGNIRRIASGDVFFSSANAA